jgi:hypothetical protein
MVVVPVVTGETMPVDAPTVATPGALLVHVPPPASVRVMVEPIHTVEGPEIGAGADIILSVVVATQPAVVV